MDKVAFLPFGLMVDKWRWGVFDGSITPANYNQAWVDLKQQYQGIAPPVPRPRDRISIRAPSSTFPATRPTRATSSRGCCSSNSTRRRATCPGWKGPLHRCSFYGNKEVGTRLNAMLAMGASKPWPDALEAFTGTREISGTRDGRIFRPAAGLAQAAEQRQAVRLVK